MKRWEENWEKSSNRTVSSSLETFLQNILIFNLIRFLCSIKFFYLNAVKTFIFAIQNKTDTFIRTYIVQIKVSVHIIDACDFSKISLFVRNKIS